MFDLRTISGKINMKNGRILFRCKDKSGIDERISHVIASSGYSLTDISGKSRDDYWFLRKEFTSTNGSEISRKEFERRFEELAQKEKFNEVYLKVTDADELKKATILVTTQTHCLEELLHAWKNQDIPLEVQLVIGNKDSCKLLSNFYGVKFKHFDMGSPGDKEKERKAESQMLPLVEDTDFLIMAKYMRILSPEFLFIYNKPVINIHHSLLPSFPGAKPYQQAYDYGVKIIGATAHFAIPKLDAGPIIFESTENVSNEKSVERYKTRGKVAERNALREAVRLFCEDRVIPYGQIEERRGKTFIFD